MSVRSALVAGLLALALIGAVADGAVAEDAALAGADAPTEGANTEGTAADDSASIPPEPSPSFPVEPAPAGDAVAPADAGAPPAEQPAEQPAVTLAAEPEVVTVVVEPETPARRSETVRRTRERGQEGDPRGGSGKPTAESTGPGRKADESDATRDLKDHPAADPAGGSAPADWEGANAGSAAAADARAAEATTDAGAFGGADGERIAPESPPARNAPPIADPRPALGAAALEPSTIITARAPPVPAPVTFAVPPLAGAAEAAAGGFARVLLGALPPAGPAPASIAGSLLPGSPAVAPPWVSEAADAGRDRAPAPTAPARTRAAGPAPATGTDAAPSIPFAPSNGGHHAAGSASPGGGAAPELWCVLVLGLALGAAHELRRTRVRLVVLRPAGFAVLRERPG
jgi:hypothetical protein